VISTGARTRGLRHVTVPASAETTRPVHLAVAVRPGLFAGRNRPGGQLGKPDPADRRVQIRHPVVPADRSGNLDGKYLLATSDPDLSAEDVALGYKNLMEAERAFRTMKSALYLRPVYHRLDDRIRALEGTHRLRW